MKNQYKLFSCKIFVLKKIILILTICFSLFSLNAQIKSDIILVVETGPILFSESENLAFFFNVEPKLKSSENTTIGLRLAVTVNSQSIENNQIDRYHIDDQSDNGVISFVPTLDYYFNENKFRPNLGIGIGYYVMAAKIEVSRFGDVFDIGVNNQIGFLLRGGFELGKIRLGLEYNVVNQADIKIPNGELIGTVENSYMGLSVGYTFGGGQRSK